jgi:uncharacterized protein (DUF1778 family)
VGLIMPQAKMAAEAKERPRGNTSKATKDDRPKIPLTGEELDTVKEAAKKVKRSVASYVAQAAVERARADLRKASGDTLVTDESSLLLLSNPEFKRRMAARLMALLEQM